MDCSRRGQRNPAHASLFLGLILFLPACNDPDGVDERYPGKKKNLMRSTKVHGTWQEIHCDGHEKLGALALQMGGVGLPIYGMKDKWGLKSTI
jgi:hypothetical protein